MADSDDEYDRKRRDKFRGERGTADSSSYRSSDRREERTRGREDWPERSRGGRSGPDYRDYRSGASGNRGYSPIRGEGPPSKRIRPDWPMDDRRYGSMPHDSYGAYGWAHDNFGPHPAHQGYGQPMPPIPARDAVAPMGATDGPPTMMSFKAFLAAQDDSITVDDAIQKYNEYKLEFRRQQLNEFFIAHKDEEWFKIKYHPEESVKRKEEQLAALKSRLNVFLELLEGQELDKVSVDVEKSDKLIRLLDIVVIKLEGGTEEDLKELDEPPQSENVTTNDKTDKTDCDKPVIIDVDAVKVKEEKEDEPKEKKAESPKPTAPLTMEIDPHLQQLQEQAKLFSRYNSVTGEPEPEPETEEKEPPPPGSSSSSSTSSSSSSSSEEEGETTNRRKSKSKTPDKSPKQKEKSKSPSVEKDSTEAEKKDKEKSGDEKAESVNDVIIEKKQTRALHKTTSIFLRNLAPTITKAEVEAMCKRYGGFLRVALADPLPERRWFRRGWVTFRRDVNIKDICWNLNNIRLRECELGAIVNRDLQRRVRPVTGVTLERPVLRADARLAARLAHLLDTRTNLWDTEPKDTDSDNMNQTENFSLNSKNPVLHKITEHLIEEASTEEEELLGLDASSDATSEQPDPELMRVLDRLILYLRIVHSVDYYNHCEYPYEDEMPNRCGIMHARSGPPANKPNQQEIQDYIKSFEGKMSAFLQDVKQLSDEELNKLGIKDPDAEVEKFIQANTQELAKDKWLCPLSGKKFKGPDFIRKHIFNKHAEKVDEVRREVAYFNAYVCDVRRPHQPEPPSRPAPQVHHVPHVPPSAPYGGGPVGGGPTAARWGWGGWAPPAPYAPRHPRFSRPRENVDRSRPLVTYNDLDFPDNGDIF